MTRKSSQPGVQLVIAGVLASVALGACAAVAAWLHAGPAWIVALVVVAAVILIGAVVASMSDRAHRVAGRVLAAAATLFALAAVALGAVAVIVLALGRVPRAEERAAVALGALGAAVAAIAFHSLRTRLSYALLRATSGVRRPPEDVVRRFGDRANRGLPVEELLEELAESLRRTMALEEVELWTAASGALRRSVAMPDRPPAELVPGARELAALVATPVAGRAWLELWLPPLLDGRDVAALRVVPACHSGELLGLVIVQRGLDDPFTDADDHALAELGRRLGVVLHNRRLDAALQSTLDDLRLTNEELRASRARLVAASDEARRRIERNLHDGAQQHLVALAINVRVARDVLADDPAAAAELLDELGTELRDTVQEIRDLAHGIYPPLLAQAGLEEALRTAASRHPSPCGVEIDELGRHGADVEAAVYFCCLEALQNAAKHAPDAPVVVRAWEDGDELWFEVTDDGPGFDVEQVRTGHGLQNMADRLGAFGGTVRWSSQPGRGTCISGRVPIGVQEPAR